MAAVAAVAVVVGASAVRAADPPKEIPVTIEGNKFTPDEIRVKAGAPAVLVVTNKDKTPEEFESKDLRIEKVIPAGKTMKIRLPSLKPGTYSFVGEYHEATAKGRIIAE
jgi:plastocyanin domain-containing protein